MADQFKRQAESVPEKVEQENSKDPSWQSLVPQSADELLTSQAHFINLQEIMEVVDIWCYKEPYTGSNDYVCLMMKINDLNLARQMYDGCPFVLQVWKNKERIYQQAHLGPIISLTTSKTEFAYVTGTGQEQDSCSQLSPSSYINVIKLYQKQIVRIPNPFVRLQLSQSTSNISLYINCKNIYMGQGNKLFTIKIQSLFSDQHDETFTTLKSSMVDGKLLTKNMYSINHDEGDDESFNSSVVSDRRRIAVHKNKQSQSDQKINEKPGPASSSIELINIDLPENRIVLNLHCDMKQSYAVKIITVNMEEDRSIVIYTYDGMGLDEEKSLKIDQIEDNIKFIHMKHLPSRRESLITVISESGQWAIFNSQYEIFIHSGLFTKDFSQLTSQAAVASHHIRIGYEGIYVKLQGQKNKSLKAKFDDSSDKLKVLYSYNLDVYFQDSSFTECYMSERFVRLNVELYSDMKLINCTLALVHSGRAISFLDLGVQNQRSWTHYLTQEIVSSQDRRDFTQVRIDMDDNEWKGFGNQGHEIKEVFFFGITQLSNTIRVLMVQKDLSLRQIVYYPEKKSAKLIQMRPIFMSLGSQIGRVVQHFDTQKCNTLGDCSSGIYFEVRSQTRLDLYTSTPTNQFRILAKELDPNLSLLRVIGAAHTLLFLVNKQTFTLYILTIPQNQGICDQNDLLLCLTEEYSNFNYRAYLKYHLSNDKLIYIENGNLAMLNLQNKKTQSIDFQNQLTQIWVEEEGLYAKDKLEQIYYVQNDLLFNQNQNAKIRVFEDPTFLVMWKPLFKNSMEQIYSQFEADPICQRVATFSSTTQLIIMGQMGSLIKGFDNSHNFNRRILAFNFVEDSQNQSEYNSSICGINSEHSQIIVWNVGNGKVTKRVQVEQDFSKYKFHTYWDGYSLIYAPGQNPDIYSWLKIKVTQLKVEVKAQFTHSLNHSLGHKLYINSNNDMLLEFRQQTFLLHSLKSKEENKFTPIKIFAACLSPLYFSPTFNTYVDFSSNLTLQFFRLDLSTFKYTKDEEFNLNQIVTYETGIQQRQKQLLIELVSDNQIRFVNLHGIEQTIRLEDMSLTSERVIIQGECFEGKRRDIALQARVIKAMDEQQTLNYVSQQREGSCTRSQKLEALLLSNNNLRMVEGVSHYNWRLIEAIINDDIDVAQVSKLETLLNVILPNGDTLLHLMTDKNSKNLLKTLNLAEQKSIFIKICPNFQGLTPLHYCTRDTNIVVASRYLSILSNYPIGDAADHIKDIMAELMALSPNAFSQYLDSRLIEVPWTPQYSEGQLKAINGQSFSVGLMNLCPTQQNQFNEKFFEADDTQENLGQKQRFPIKMMMSDIPDLHLLSDKTGQKMLFQLIKMKNLESIFSSRYIQAMIESQWAVLKQSIITKTLYPYLVYLILFNIYVLYIVVQEKNIMMNILRYLVEISLIILIFINFKSKFTNNVKEQALRYHIWFFLDVIPRVLVLISILMHYIFGGESFLVSIYAFAIFCSWIGLMCFLRLNRGTGYLVRLIFEVIQDMYYFLTVMGLHMFAFTGAFYVLQQPSYSNGSAQIDYDTPYNIMVGYLDAAAFTFQLLLGDFDTSTFNPDTYVLSWFFFVVATVLLIIVMLNLLISIISNTYSKVQSQTNEKMYSEFVRLIFENKHHFDAHSFDTANNLNSRYLYVAQPEDQKNDPNVVATQASNNSEIIRMLREIKDKQLHQEHKIDAQIKLMQEQIDAIKDKSAKP